MKEFAFPLIVFAFLIGIACGLLGGFNMGEDKGRIEGRCSTYQSFAVAAGYGAEQHILPLECRGKVTNT